jgi:transposase
MFEQGATQAEVARSAGVSRQTASRWYHAWRAGGAEALRRPERLGRPPRLSAAQVRAVEQALLKGPRANGFANDLWTLARVGTVIERLTGVRYSTAHVWRMLRAMGWSLQRPARRATERDEAAIARWKRERWPKVKKTPGSAARGSSSKTSRASRSPHRSGAPGRRAAARQS